MVPITYLFLRKVDPSGGTVIKGGSCGHRGLLRRDRSQFMLKMVDKYPMKIQVKGAMVEFRAKKIWITSNSNWELWYATEFMRIAEHKTAFNRRITSVREYSTRYVEPKGDKDATCGRPDQ